MMNKKKQIRKKDIKEKLVDQWLKEDFEWPRANSNTGRHYAGDHSNPSYTYGDSTIRPASYQLTPAPLNTSRGQFSQSARIPRIPNPGYRESASPSQPQFPLRNFSANQPVR
ncbi:uncharacterized protein LOC144543520 isoform X2 [Centroberyx gerrardi]